MVLRDASASKNHEPYFCPKERACRRLRSKSKKIIGFSLMNSADVNANVDFLVNIVVNFLMSRGCAVWGEVA